MNRFSLTLFAVVTAAAAAAPAQSTQPAKAKPPSFESAYGMIADRNPFLRERHKPRSADEMRRPRTESRPARTVAQSFVLRGVAIEDDQLHAYLEDTRGGSGVRVSPGDPLGDGHVADIAIDAIAYTANGRTTWVQVGQDLTGGRGSTDNPSASASATPSASATQPSGVAPPPLPPGGGTLEERMKLRAAQQRGKR